MKRLLIFISLILVGCSMTLNKISDTPGYLLNPSYKDLTEMEILSLNRFGIDMYNSLKTNDNLFISPASIHLALGMVSNGAASDTKTQMEEVLYMHNMTQDEINESNYNLQALILKNEKFKLTNSLWINENYQGKIKKDFINQNKKYYGAMVSLVDFSDKATYKTINKWVKENTNGKIKQAVDEDIKLDTVMYLINTIYFKDNWKKSFDKNSTYKEEFKTIDEVLKVDMMHKIDSVGYIENDELQGVLLPYESSDASMFVILPKNSIDNLNVDSHMLNNLLNQMKINTQNVSISIPKVNIEYDQNLTDVLIDMGMVNAFDFEADFSNIITDEKLHIDNVMHKTFLAIDEEGTEATGATIINMTNSSSVASHEFKVDHPFILGIVDNKTNALIFIGNVYKP